MIQELGLRTLFRRACLSKPGGVQLMERFGCFIHGSCEAFYDMVRDIWAKLL